MWINNQHSFTDPEIRSNQFAIILQAETQLTCQNIVNVTKKWKASLIDDRSDTELFALNMNVLTTDTNQLVINPHFLTPGLYKCTFQIAFNASNCMENQQTFDETTTYLKIMSSDMVVILQPGPFPRTLINSVAVSSKDVILLQPGIFSFYPHVDFSTPLVSISLTLKFCLFSFVNAIYRNI